MPALGHPGGDLCARLEPELPKDPFDVTIDGARRQDQCLRDRLVGLAPCDQVSDLTLASVQRGKRVRHALRWCRERAHELEAQIDRFVDADPGLLSNQLMAPGFSES